VARTRSGATRTFLEAEGTRVSLPRATAWWCAGDLGGPWRPLQTRPSTTLGRSPAGEPTVPRRAVVERCGLLADGGRIITGCLGFGKVRVAPRSSPRQPTPTLRRSHRAGLGRPASCHKMPLPPRAHPEQTRSSELRTPWVPRRGPPRPRFLDTPRSRRIPHDFRNAAAPTKPGLQQPGIVRRRGRAPQPPNSRPPVHYPTETAEDP